MANMNMPAGFGGLMRYNEEYDSKLMIDPKYVIVMVVLAILFVFGLKMFWKVFLPLI
jgi:preprotein translocase subunit Sec61beta